MLESSAPLIELNRITVIRGQVVALRDVTLRIQAGQNVCILGPNGSGKSTLIKTIARECYPLARQGSSMSIMGKERWDVFELRSHLGIVSQDLLGPHAADVNGLDVVLSSFFSSTHMFPHHHPTGEQVACAHAALQKLGIAHLADRSMRQMSSGESKRVLIARALVHNPKTLLFDEPAGALDIAAQFHLRDAMRQLAQSGLGIILVTHHVSEIIPEIDRVILLKEGRVFADDVKERVLTSEKLSSLFAVPVQVFRSDGYFHIH
jgi:iron complex transport system ATP-binding protein